MTNPSIIQRETQTTGLGVMIGGCSFDSQHGGPNGILRMLFFLASGTQTTTKVTTQLRDTNGRNE